MLKIWHASNFRRTVAGLALIAAPLLLTITDATFPSGNPGPDPAAQLAFMAQHHDAMLLSGLLFLLFPIPFIPAILGLMHLLRERGVVLGHIGGAFALLGVLASAAAGAVRLVPLAMTGPGLDQTAMAALFGQMLRDPMFAPIFLLTMGFHLGLILLGLGVWRAGIQPRWAGPCIVLALVGYLVLSTVIGEGALPVGVLAGVLLTVGMGALGWRLLTASDAFWEQLERPPVAAQPVAA
jgi:Domain of unknown function (DUF4386)